MGWLNAHLEMFVKARLGYTPVQDKGIPFFTVEERSLIKSSWKSVKAAAEGKTILLAGRDVFIYEILARREDYPTLFMPECSRETADMLAPTLDRGDILLVDTGFIGSIPRKLGISNFKLLSYSGNRTENLLRRTYRSVGHIQIFPNLTGSRGLALKMERTPKYWETARVMDGRIIQNYSEREEFERAAFLTMEIYTDSSPRVIARRIQPRRRGFNAHYEF